MTALLAEEDAAAGAIKSKPKKIKKKDDLGALLSEGLAKAPKTKAQKEDEARKKAKEAARLKQAEEEAAAANKKPDPLAPAPLVPNMNRASFFVEEGEAGSGAFETSTKFASVFSSYKPSFHAFSVFSSIEFACCLSTTMLTLPLCLPC